MNSEEEFILQRLIQACKTRSGRSMLRGLIKAHQPKTPADHERLARAQVRRLRQQQKRLGK